MSIYAASASASASASARKHVGGDRLGLDQCLANLIDLRFEFWRSFAQAMIVPGTIRAALANYRRVFRSTFTNPADIQNLADTLELPACLGRNWCRTPALVAARLDNVDCFARINVLRFERRRKINTSAKDVWVSSCVLAAYGLTAIQALVIAGSQNRYLC